MSDGGLRGCRQRTYNEKGWRELIGEDDPPGQLVHSYGFSADASVFSFYLGRLKS